MGEFPSRVLAVSGLAIALAAPAGSANETAARWTFEGRPGGGENVPRVAASGTCAGNAFSSAGRTGAVRLFHSDAAGLRWRPSRIDGSSAPVLGVLDVAGSGRADRGFAVGLRGILRTIDGGRNWRTVLPTGTGFSIASDRRARRVYATLTQADAERRQVVLSSDGGGVSWRASGPITVGSRTIDSWTPGPVTVAPNRPATVYVGFGDGADTTLFGTPQVLVNSVARSLDGGRTWSLPRRGFGRQVPQSLAVAPGAPRTLFAGTRRGVYRSTDGGQVWRRFSSGLALRRVRSIDEIVISRGRAYRVYAITNAGIYESRDRGVRWRLLGARPKGVSPLDGALLPGGRGLLVSGRGGTARFVQGGAVGCR